MGRDRGNRQSDVSLERVQCFHRGALSPTADLEARRTTRPLASTVLPKWVQTQTQPRRAALKHLETRKILVSGA